MQRRTFLQLGVGTALASPLFAAPGELNAADKFVAADKLDAAADPLAKACSDGRIRAAALYVRHGKTEYVKNFGDSKSADDPFLLASITKTLAAAAVMTLYDQGRFQLDDPAKKFIPEFAGDGRERITIRQLLSHVSGLPDQLPENNALRKRHAKLDEFVAGAIRTPLLFEPGARYSYSSMGILLATEIAMRISGTGIIELVNKSVILPLGMKHAALGLGPFKLEEVILNQVEHAAPESGAGDPSAKDWNWNSPFWRNLGAPWGGAHASASNVAQFLSEFLHPQGKIFKPETARLMISNQNREGLTPRGLGFEIGTKAGGRRSSPKTFGHSGSTGTLCWADPATDTICVVLTTLPLRANNPHPARVTSDRRTEAVTA
jgi:CubicO group peptidase (beta-lactamase class C family)